MSTCDGHEIGWPTCRGSKNRFTNEDPAAAVAVDTLVSLSKCGSGCHIIQKHHSLSHSYPHTHTLSLSLSLSLSLPQCCYVFSEQLVIFEASSWCSSDFFFWREMNLLKFLVSRFSHVWRSSNLRCHKTGQGSRFDSRIIQIVWGQNCDKKSLTIMSVFKSMLLSTFLYATPSLNLGYIQ